MEPYIGQITTFPYNFPPNHWAFCDGQILSIAQNTALFSLLGTVYGGNGQTTFALPDLRGRAMVHPGQGAGLSVISQGEQGGTITQTMLTTNMPAHTHTVSVAVSTEAGEEGLPTNYIASNSNAFITGSTPGSVLGGVTSQPAGQGLPFSIANPYLGLNCCIALQGIFPSRN